MGQFTLHLFELHQSLLLIHPQPSKQAQGCTNFFRGCTPCRKPKRSPSLRYYFIYLLARSLGARNVVEAGTSFGVSTIYLASAVGQNMAQGKNSLEATTIAGKVIATEKEHAKAVRAREYWKEAGDEVEPWIELRDGDLLETLKIEEGTPQEIDLLLLDIWTPLALPTLKIVQPRLKRGAVVITDNVSVAKFLYKEFLEYIRRPENGFRPLTIPFSGGLEVSVYLPEE